MNVKTQEIVGHGQGDIIKIAALSGAAFVFSAGYAGGCPSMLNTALAAVYPEYAAAVFLSSVVYYIFVGGFASGVIQLLGIMTVAVLSTAFFRGSKKDSPLLTSALTIMVLLLFSIAVSAVTYSAPETVIGRGIASLIAGGFVYAYKSLQLENRMTHMIPIGGVNGVMTAVVYTAAVSSLASVSLGVLNLGRTVGCAVLLCIARRYRMTGGAGVGALTAFAVFIGASPLAGNTLLLATAGLICGAFAELGVLAVALSFISVCAVGLATIGSGADGWHMFFDVMVGSLAFAAVPQGLMRRAMSLLFGGVSASDNVGRATASRLGFVSASLGEIRSQLALVTAAMDRKASERKLSETVFDNMCRSCELRCICHKDPVRSSQHFNELEQIAMQFNGVSDSDVKSSFRECRFPELIADSFNYAYKNYLDSRAARLHITELRTLISEQLCSMEEILSDLSGRIGRIRSVDRELSERVGGYLSRTGYRNARASVYLDDAGFRHVEIFISGEYISDRMELSLAVSDIVDCMFDLPVISKADKLTRILLTEQPLYELSLGSFCASSTDNGYSGDTFDTVALSSCESCALLSDGMGTGKRAKLDSMFAVSLASKLLSSGVSMRSSLRLINTVLKVKGWEESFATLDMLRFDLCAGTAELLKAGAAPTYLYRDGVLKPFGGQAFPAGILDHCSPDEFMIKLYDGDVLLMISDGVSDEKVRAAFSELGEGRPDPKAFAQTLGELAMQTEIKAHRDDITIAVFAVNYRVNKQKSDI